MLERVAYCLHCDTEFKTTNLRRVFCSDKCKVRYNRERRLTCFYCGDLAGSRDHIVPHSATCDKARKWRSDYVNCCRECNSLLGGDLITPLSHRIGVLFDRFTKRNKLNRPFIQWDEEDLEDLSDDMTRFIKASQRQRVTNEQRASHIRLMELTVRAYEQERPTEKRE